MPLYPALGFILIRSLLVSAWSFGILMATTPPAVEAGLVIGAQDQAVVGWAVLVGKIAKLAGRYLLVLLVLGFYIEFGDSDVTKPFCRGVTCNGIFGKLSGNKIWTFPIVLVVNQKYARISHLPFIPKITRNGRTQPFNKQPSKNKRFLTGSP